MVGGVVDGVRGAHAVGRADGALEQGGAAIDGELGLVIKDDEHLFAVIVEMLADASAGMEHAAVQEDEVGGQGLVGHQGTEIHGAGAVMHRLEGGGLFEVVMGDL